MGKLLTPRNSVLIVVALIVLIAGALLVKIPLPGIQLPAERIPGTPLTNTLLATFLADAVVLILAILATRNMKMIPSGLQNLAEYIIGGFSNFSRSVAGSNWQLIFPMAMTYFIFLSVANWMEQIPGFDSIGILQHPEAAGATAYQVTQGVLPSLTNVVAASPQQGYVLVPFLRGAATDLNLTIGYALITMVFVQIMGFRFQGLSYLKKFFVSPLKNPIGTFVGILELISEFAKIVSLAFRLFGNIFAGQVLLFVMHFLVPLLIPLPFMSLELFVGFMQAFVFAVLTLLFAGEATIRHEEHAPEAADPEHATTEELQLATTAPA